MCLMIRAKFGILGQAMAYEVLAWITESGGCYAEWNDDKPAEFASTRMFDLSLIGKVREVFEFMVEIGFFDQTAFKAGFLTSEGMVMSAIFVPSTVSVATRRRSAVVKRHITARLSPMASLLNKVNCT